MLIHQCNAFDAFFVLNCPYQH